jgi:ATP synthase protein I
MAGKGKGYPGWLRSYGIGFEFATAVAVFGLIGYWVDRKFGSSPWGVLVGTGLGLTGGTYNLIRESLTAFRRLPKTHRRDDQPPDQSGKTGRDRPDDGTPPNEQ